MRFGVNCWVWSSPVTTEELKRLAPKVAGMGFDWIEIEEPALENRLCDLFEGLVDLAVEFDLIVKRF